MRFGWLLAFIMASLVYVVNATDEAVLKPAGADMLKDAISKVKAVNSLNPSKLRASTVPESPVLKFDPLNLGKLDTTSTSNLKNAPHIRAQTTSDKGWETAVVKLTGKINVEKLDTSPTGKWKTAFDKLKASNQLKNVDEAKAAKITKKVAQEIAKDPSKWRYVKVAAEITFGVALTGLVVVGLQSMAD